MGNYFSRNTDTVTIPLPLLSLLYSVSKLDIDVFSPAEICFRNCWRQGLTCENTLIHFQQKPFQMMTDNLSVWLDTTSKYWLYRIGTFLMHWEQGKQSISFTTELSLIANNELPRTIVQLMSLAPKERAV